MIEINSISNITEVVCDRCGIKTGQRLPIESNICLACGGNLVGIRISRNAVTGRILFAERIDP